MRAKPWRAPRVRPAAAAMAVLAAGLALPDAGARAQTLDCTYPVGPVAEIICSDAALADLDQAMGDAFRDVVRSSPRDERPAVLRDQRDWLAQRNDCLGAGDVRECLRVAMERRISDLSQGLAGTIAAEPQGPRPPVEQQPLPDLPAAAAPVAAAPPTPPRVGGPRDEPAAEAAPEPSPPPAPELAGGGPPVITAPSAPAPLDDADAQKIAEFLSASVWRAEIASGIRPGTIYIFHSNGLLITADCVEAYRVGDWRVEGAGLRLDDGAGTRALAEIVGSGNGFVRLKITDRGDGRPRDIVFRAVRGPFACVPTR